MLIVLIVLSIVSLFVYPVKANGLDFQAFYCAGKAIAQHANPYLNQPMHDCELATSPPFFKLYPNVTVPAPLPPYALALFVPFALLPYLSAKLLWWALLLGTVALISWLTFKLSGLPLAVCIAASAVAVAGPSIPQLALAPVPIALLCLAAFFVRRQRWNGAAVCAVLAMIEPHVTLPADVALFLFVPAMRWRLVGGAALLGILSLLATGPPVFIWYFTTLLPAHAASEVNNLGQFSLTTMLYHVGLSKHTAIAVGSIQYAIMVVTGIWLGARLCNRFGDRALLVLTPAAFSVMGGSFIHLSEIAVAVPLACVLAARGKTTLAWLGVLLLAVPWESVVNWAFLAPSAALALVWILWSRWRTMPLLLLLGSMAFVLLDVRLHITAVTAFLDSHATSAYIGPAKPGASAELTWQAFNALQSTGPLWWSEKAVTFSAFAIMLVLAIRLLRQGDAKRSRNLLA